MNSLTWFIYLTQVTDSISTGAWFWVAAIPVILVSLSIGTAAYNSEHSRYNDDALYPWQRKWFKGVIIAWIFALLCGFFIPNQKTMILMAASEIGGKVVNSEKFNNTVDPALDLLNVWIVKEKEKLLDSGKK